MDKTYQWTLEEYVLRCEIDSTLREIVVEGPSDLLVYANFCRAEDLADVNLIDGDYILVETAAVEAAGFQTGNKGRLLTVGTALQARSEDVSVEGNVVLVVDRDFDEDVPPAAARFVLMTDRYSVENYAYDAAVLDRLFGFCLGQKLVPGGRGGNVPARNVPVEGRSVLASVEQACVALATARCALHANGIGLPTQWLARVMVDSSGAMTVDRDAIMSAALKGRSFETRDAVLNMLPGCTQRLSADPARFVRGRDFVSVLHKLLRSGWAKKAFGVRFPSMDDEQLRGLLLLALDWPSLVAQPLFDGLRARFA